MKAELITDRSTLNTLESSVQSLINDGLGLFKTYINYDVLREAIIFALIEYSSKDRKHESSRVMYLADKVYEKVSITLDEKKLSDLSHELEMLRSLVCKEDNTEDNIF